MWWWHNIFYGKGTNFALDNREEFYNLCLNVDVLLHKSNITSPIAPTCSLKLTELIYTRISKQQHNFTPSSTMEIGLAFIGLEWIGMVKKLVGEVATRSYKHGSWVQLALVIRDRGATKPSFKKLPENLSFSLFTTGTTSSSLRQSGDKAEPCVEQMVKVVPPLTANTL